MESLKRVYIAGPFFTDEQNIVIEKIKTILKMLTMSYYSPKDHTRYVKGDPPAVAKKCFDENIDEINKCELMIAVVDDFDPGTLFEMGCFFTVKKPILSFSSVPKRKLNIMLTQASIGFANGFGELVDKLVRINSGEFTQEQFFGDQE